MKQTEVRVTAAHIAHGVTMDCRKCPVALALLEALGPDARVAVDAAEITAWTPAGRWVATPAPAAEQFIYAFDGYISVYPFEFTLTWRDAYGDEADGEQP